MNTENLKVWLSFSESPIKNFFQGENWTAYGNPTINQNSLQLDGSSYIQSGEIELGGQDFTVDGWCYTDPNCAEGARVFNIHLSPDTGNTLVKLRHPAGSSNWRLILLRRLKIQKINQRKRIPRKTIFRAKINLKFFQADEQYYS